MPTTILFPGDVSANEIPVFLQFHWGDYSRYNSDRTTEAVVGKGNYISVPYPRLFNVGNNIPYTNSASIAGSPLERLKQSFDNITVGAERMIDYFFRGGK